MSHRAIKHARLMQATREMRAWIGKPDDRKQQVRPCFCVGPQNGQPACPCAMRNISIQDGRYVQIVDLGPAPEEIPFR